MNALLAVALLLPSQSVTPPDPAEAFQRGLDARTDAAVARKHFRDAAAGFDALWAEGNRSARLAVDRGRSHFLAGNVPRAVAAFRAGLRESPHDVDILRGLAECRAAIPYPTPAKPDERLQPDPPRGWRYRVSEWDLFRLTVLSTALVVIGLARRFTARDGWAVPVVAMGGVGALVCGVAFLKLNAEASAEAERPTLVVLAEATLRKGNGQTHPPRIDAPLPRGTEVTERARRGGWVQVEVASGTVGWLPESVLLPAE